MRRPIRRLIRQKAPRPWPLRSMRTAVAVLADYAAATAAWLIHYSTDYVFDGAKSTSYLETDPPRPLNVYGQSKYAGEQAILAAGCQTLILRVSWLYAAHGKNFPKTILRLAQQRERLSLVADQRGAPTSADFVAAATALLLRRLQGAEAASLAGVYHLTASGVTSWYGYAHLLLTQVQSWGGALGLALFARGVAGSA